MRRVLRTELPLWSRFFGVHPWQIDRLTLAEISEYQSTLRQIDAAGGDPWQVARVE